MSKKYIVLAATLGLLLTTVSAVPAQAIKVAPLTYNVQLASGQKKKGFVDVTNTDQAKTTFIFSVQAFKQVNAAGDLQFYDDERLQAGIMLDYKTFDLEPRQTLHLAFVADGTKLPSGDSFAAIFARTVPRGESASATGVRVGTILTIQNGTPAEHKAEITNLTVPFLQIGSSVKGSYGIKNTSDSQKSAGFMPQVELAIDPFHQTSQNQSSLVFAGIERQNDFAVETGRFGFYQVTAAFGQSHKTAWVFVATPLGIVVFITIIGFILIAVTALLKKYHRPHRGTRKSTKWHNPTRN